MIYEILTLLLSQILIYLQEFKDLETLPFHCSLSRCALRARTGIFHFPLFKGRTYILSESIFLRVRRLLSAQLQDSVNAMERADSDGTMREAIREVDRTIDEVRASQEQTMTRRLQASRYKTMITAKVDELTEKARFALQQGREDLAEGALSLQVDFEKEAQQLEQLQMLARDEETKLDKSITALRTRKRQMEEALAAYTAARLEASMGGDSDFKQGRDVENKVNRGEAAFDRATPGAGSSGVSISDPKASDEVAEIENMQKSAVVALRLAALKRSNQAA